MPSQLSLIIPTRNAGLWLTSLLDALSSQTIQLQEIIVIDSESEDDTINIARSYERVRLIQIERKDFNHGGTRDRALRESRGDIVLFMTQDALPADKRYIENLIRPFDDDRVAAVSARQVARPDARPFEKLVRGFNYPDISRVWDKGDIESRGVRAFMISNVCAAYRRSAYEAVGGFDKTLPTNEDMLMAARLLDSGYRLAYCAEAVVLHSHRHTLREEYRRNAKIGQFLQMHADDLHGVKETGEGIALVKQVFKRLIQDGQLFEAVTFFFNCAARYLGNRAGRRTVRKDKA